MKIDHENMKELAERLDRHNSTLKEIDVDSVCSMAYQLQYFFEAMEKIKEQADTWGKSAFIEYRGISEGYKKSLELLTNVMIDKEE